LSRRRGTRGACIFSFGRRRRGSLGDITSTGGGSCPADSAQVLAGGVVDYEHLPDGEAITVGVMPATVRHVVVVDNAGARRAIPLTDGVFVIRSAGVRQILTPGRGSTPLVP
jgi:hypothetical protein